jgi:hypothetical protein
MALTFNSQVHVLSGLIYVSFSYWSQNQLAKCWLIRCFFAMVLSLHVRCILNFGDPFILTWEFCFICVWFLIVICSYDYLQDNTVKIRLLNNLDQCLKAGRKYSWYMFLVSNACVALLSGLKVLLIFVINWALTVWFIFLILIFTVLSVQELLTSRGAQSLPTDIFSMVQSIFKVIGTRHFKHSKLWSPSLLSSNLTWSLHQGILMLSEISIAQRRAACEGLGLLARTGNDIFTARMVCLLFILLLFILQH